MNANLAQAGETFWNNLLSPDGYNTMGQMAVDLSKGVPVGGAMGRGAQTFTRNKAYQREAGKQSNFQDKVMQMLYNGSLLSNPEDNVGADSINIGGDGSITVKSKPSPEKPTVGKQKALESVRAPKGRTSSSPFR